MAKMTENTAKIFNFLRDHADADYTAVDVAEALGMRPVSVNSTFTSGIQRKGLGERVLAEKELPDGTHDKVKLLKITPAGMKYVDEDEE